MSDRPVALFLDKASLHPQDLDFSRLEQVADWQWFDNVRTTDIGSALSKAEIIVSNKVVLDQAVLERCESLKLICVAATGVNNIDLDAAHRRGVQVCNVRAYATASVTQHVFSMLLSLTKRLSGYHQSALQGRWSRSDFFCYFGEPFNDLDGKKIGVIGYGELGQSVARVAECFGMEVLVAKRNPDDHRPDRVDLSILLAVSDVVTLHCPLTEDNRHLIAERQLSLMKPGAFIINTARGGLIDESALLKALVDGQLGGAALDVLEEEPPSIDNALLRYRGDNLIITPHIAWASTESRQRLLDEIALNIEAFQQGESRNNV